MAAIKKRRCPNHTFSIYPNDNQNNAHKFHHKISNHSDQSLRFNQNKIQTQHHQQPQPYQHHQQPQPYQHHQQPQPYQQPQNEIHNSNQTLEFVIDKINDLSENINKLTKYVSNFGDRLNNIELKMSHIENILMTLPENNMNQQFECNSYQMMTEEDTKPNLCSYIV